MRQWLAETWKHLFGITGLVMAAIGLIWIASLPAFVADEIAFFIWSDNMLRGSEYQSIWSPLFRPNLAGYGSSYWTLYLNLIDWFGTDAIWVMRTLSCFVFVSIPIAIASVGNLARKHFGYLLAGLWLSMPIAWWCGKITGPETFALAFAVYGILLLYVNSCLCVSSNPTRDKAVRILSWMLIGGSVSLKLTMMPAAIFAFLIRFMQPSTDEGLSGRDTMRQMFEAIGLMAFGFIVCTPVALFNFPEFIRQIGSLPGGDAWNLTSARWAISNQNWGWDGVFAGGLIQWSLCPLAFMVIAVLLLVKQRRVLLVLLVSFLACWGMIASKGALLGWYWFGWIPTIVLSLLWTVKRDESNLGLTMALAIGIAINAFYQTPDILERYEMKSRQVIALSHLPLVQQELSKHCAQRNYDLILDYWEVSHVGGLDFVDTPETELVQMSLPQFSYLTTSSEQRIGEHSKPISRGVEANAFCRIGDLAEHGTEGKSVLIVVSKRLASKHNFSDFDKFVRERVIPKSPHGTSYAQLVDLPDTSVYEIRTNQMVVEAPRADSKSL